MVGFHVHCLRSPKVCGKIVLKKNVGYSKGIGFLFACRGKEWGKNHTSCCDETVGGVMKLGGSWGVPATLTDGGAFRAHIHTHMGDVHFRDYPNIGYTHISGWEGRSNRVW